MINDIGEESNDDGETRCPNPRRFLTTKTGFQKFEGKIQRRIIRQPQYLEVIRNGALSVFAHQEQSVAPDENVAWLREHDHIVNPPTAGFLANRKRTSSRPAAK